MAALYAPLLSLLPFAFASPGGMPWSGPMPTPEGMLAAVGVSPRPTDPPGAEGLPRELRPRQNYEFPPPDNWCGFVSGFYSDPLSCSIGLTCVNSGAAVGCCPATTGFCNALYTSCANYNDRCDASCLADPAVRKCADARRPYCGTFGFAGGTRLYNCLPSAVPLASVEFLNDFYFTAIGSTIGKDSSDAFLYTPSVQLATTGAAASASDFNDYLPSDFSALFTSALGTSLPSLTGVVFGTSTGKSSSDDGLSTGAIAGIAVGAVIGGLILLGALIFLLVLARKRKRRQAAAPQPQQPYGAYPPPMQQQALPQGYPTPGKTAYDGYQAVPQKDGMPPPGSGYGGTPPPPPTPGTQPQMSPYLAPPGSAGTGAFQNLPPGSVRDSSISAPGTFTNQETSTINTSLSPPSPSPTYATLPPGAHPQSAFIPPPSPNHHEVDATLGNPGIPSTTPSGNAGPLAPREVDATMGNPGVPRDGSGVPPIQGVPGGSPSSTEVDGRNLTSAPSPTTAANGPANNLQPTGQSGMRASLNAPFSHDAGPFEMGNSDR